MTLLHAAPGAQGDQRAGLARRSMDERRRPPLRRAARELCVRVRGATSRPTRTRTRTSISTSTTRTIGISRLGPLSNINAKYLTARFRRGTRSSRTRTTTHSESARRGYTQIKGSTVPNLNVAGFWDQEDPWGPWQIFHQAERSDPEHTNLMVAGPWFHGSVAYAAQRQHRHHPARRTCHGARVPREHRGAVLPLLPPRQGHEAGVAARRCSRPDRTRGGRTTSWPPKGATPTNLYLHSDGTLSFDRPHGVEPARLSRVRLRSGEPGAVPAAPDLADVSGR